MIINTNTDAANTFRSLNKNNRKTDKSLEKLASGMKINRAADDSAGLAISEKMRAQIRGLAQDERNIDDAISMFNVAEGGMEQIENMIHRIRELAVQGASDTNTDADRVQLQKEVDQLIEGIDRIASDTEFNTHKVLLGKVKTSSNYALFKSKQPFSAQVSFLKNTVGVNWPINETSYFQINTINGGSVTTAYEPMDGFINSWYSGNSPNNDPTFKDFLLNLDPAGDPREAQFLADAIAAAVNNAITNYNNNNGTSYPPVTGLVVGNDEIAFQMGAGDQFYITWGNCSPASSNSLGHGLLHSSTRFGGTVDLGPGGKTYENDYIIQVGANIDQNIKFSIPVMPIERIGDLGPPERMIADADVSTQSNANDTISLCDIALDYVNNGRTILGAYVNRLEYAKFNVTNYHENISSAESRLRDTNISKEMSEMVKGNILSQAATAMLAQANQKPQDVLQLLR